MQLLKLTPPLEPRLSAAAHLRGAGGLTTCVRCIEHALVEQRHKARMHQQLRTCVVQEG
jgi:hypothetical protein